MHSHHIYMKQKEGASVQDSGETERERERVCVCVCEGAWIATNGGSISCKNCLLRNGPFGISQD